MIRRHRKSIGSIWRLLNPGQQALLVPVYLRKGDTIGELAAGFSVSVTTAWRNVEETIRLLAMRAPTVARALATAKQPGQAYVIIDGTRFRSTGWPMTGGSTPACIAAIGGESAGHRLP